MTLSLIATTLLFFASPSDEGSSFVLEEYSQPAWGAKECRFRISPLSHKVFVSPLFLVESRRQLFLLKPRRMSERIWQNILSQDWQEDFTEESISPLLQAFHMDYDICPGSAEFEITAEIPFEVFQILR